MKSSLLADLKKLKSTRFAQETVKHKPVTAQNDIKRPREKSPQQEIPTSKNSKASYNRKLFKDYSFCFPVKDINLTPFVISCLSKSLQERRGKVVPFSEKLENVECNFIVCSRIANLPSLKKKVEGKIEYQKILDFKFLKHSIQKNILLPFQTYILYEGIDDDKSDTIEKQMRLDNDGYPYGNIDGQDRTDQMSTHDLIKKKIKTTDQGATQRPEESKPARRYPDKRFFSCNNQNMLEKNPMNALIVKNLSLLLRIHTNENDIARRMTYMKAISAVKNYPLDITSVDILDKLKPTLGHRTRSKIKQIIETGKLERLTQMFSKEKTIVLEQLNKIWGLGPARATDLYDKYHIKGVEDLRQRVGKSDEHGKIFLSKNQMIGLKYYEQLQNRMPWSLVTEMFEVVRDVIQKIAGEEYDVQCCGSYRRKKQTCGDMDIILTRKDGAFDKRFLYDLISRLQQENFLTDHLNLPRFCEEKTTMSYMGVCQFKGAEQEAYAHHRIDIKNYPKDMFAFAILYFTGSDRFNMSIRSYAKKNGLMLNDKGFLKVMGNGKVDKNGLNVVCHTERQIFEYLGLDYKTPEERSI